MPDAGHSAREPGISRALVAAMDAIRDNLRGPPPTADPTPVPGLPSANPECVYSSCSSTTAQRKLIKVCRVVFPWPRQLRVRFHQEVVPRKGLAGTSPTPTATFSCGVLSMHRLTLLDLHLINSSLPEYPARATTSRLPPGLALRDARIPPICWSPVPVLCLVR